MTAPKTSRKEPPKSIDEIHLKPEISKLIYSLPDLRPDYFAGDFFFNFYGGETCLRFGCKYSDSSLERGENNSSYWVISEQFPQAPKIEFFDCEKIQDRTFIYGYSPGFLLAENYIESGCNSVSLIQENTVLTIIKLKKLNPQNEKATSLPAISSFLDAKKDTELKKFASDFLHKKERLANLPIFKFLDYLPKKVESWQLTTVFCIYSGQKIGKEMHIISSIQGNYKKNNRYINLILNFIYKMSEGKIQLYSPIQEEKLNNLLISKLRVGKNMKIIYYDSKNNYTIQASNNESTPNPDQYEKDLKMLLLSAQKNLEKYNCIEQTMEFIGQQKTHSSDYPPKIK